jgi:DNA adenine methylase
MTEVLQRSFLKWAGGKYNALPQIFKHMPREGHCLVEPFIGSATVALNTNFKHYILNDLNPDIINLYKYVVADVERFIKALSPYFSGAFHNEKDYYRLRDEFNATNCTWKRSLLFVYLNRHGYNGLARYNKSGGFNVPVGGYKTIRFPVDELRFFAKKMAHAEFHCGPFDALYFRRKKGTVIYCDPPYLELSKTASFSGYTSKGFPDSEHKSIDSLSKKWSKQGGRVYVSNHRVPVIEKLYPSSVGFVDFPVNRSISQKGKMRTPAMETLLFY